MLDACLPMYIHDGGFRSGGLLTGTLGQAVGIGEGKGKGEKRDKALEVRNIHGDRCPNRGI